MKKQSSPLPTYALILKGALVSIFLINVFIKVPTFFFYLNILFILTNLVLGFVEGKRAIITNTFLLLCALVQFVVIIDYLATIFGSIVSIVHLVRYYRQSQE